MLAVLFAVSVARADCPTAYTLDSLVVDLGRAEEALRAGEHTRAGEAARALEAGLACLDTALSTALTGRLYRSLGSALVAGEGYDDGLGWLSTAVELEPNYVFGLGELAADHPGFAAFEIAKSKPVPGPAPLSDRALGKGIWHLDGRNLAQPEATVDRPHVLQNTTGGEVRSWVISGNQFPPEVLTTAKTVADPKPSGRPKKRSCKGGLRLKSFIDDQGKYCPATPPEQAMLLFSAPVVLGVAGGLYAESYRQKKLSAAAPDLAELERHRRLNNRVYVASLGTAALGIGLGVFGATYTGTF